MLLILAAVAQATIAAQALDPAGLAAISDGVAFGDVTELRTLMEDEKIWTIATVTGAKGEAPLRGGETEVWIPGGCIEDLCLTIAGTPKVTVGERVFVFLRKNEPTSWSQGLFHVKGNVATRDTRGMSMSDGVAPKASFALSELIKVAPAL